MRGANFVYFFTVQGFFIGIFFALFRASSPFDVLYYTFLVTGFFYLFSHLSVAFYFRTIVHKSDFFPKERHELELDKIMHEIDRREEFIERRPHMDTTMMAGKT